MLIALKFMCWVMTIWLTQVNTITMIRKQEVPITNFLIQAIAITGLMLMYGLL